MDRNLVHELRQLFIDGAIPSKLIHHIVAHHGNSERLHLLIRDYFKEAFSVPLIRNVVSEEEYSPKLRHAHFNREVVPELIQRIGDWNTANLEGSWLNG